MGRLVIWSLDGALVIYNRMEIQKVGPQQSHNLLLTTFLPSRQIKHLAFVRLDHPKSVFHCNAELRFLSGLVAATTNTIHLYTLYDNATALEIGSWRLHEDITGVAGWDKIIVVSTAQKVVGFKYEGGLLKNAFLISLQFLQLDPQDTCSVLADRMGHYLVIHVRNYLLLCFSETLTGKYKGRVQERGKVELVSEEVRWSESSKNHVLDMVRIKLVNLDINKIEQIQTMEDAIYFIGHRNRQKTLFSIHVSSFFQSVESPVVNAVPTKDQPPANAKVIVFHAHQRATTTYDFLYYHPQTNSITLKSQHTTYEVGTCEGSAQVFQQGSTLFPLLVWEREKGRFRLIEKYKTFQENYQFRVKQLAEGWFAERVIFREGVAVLASRSGVVLVSPAGGWNRIHQSLGNIIDFHYGRDMLLIENFEGKQTRLHELTKGPRVDPKPFVTHKKKMFLENLSDLIAIYSFLLGQKNLEILAVRRGTGANKFYALYRQGAAEFDCLLEDIRDYEEATINGESVLLVQTKTESSLIVTAGQQGLNLEPFMWSGWKMPKRWCLSDYLIAYDEQRSWVFFSIATRQERRVEVPRQRQGEVAAFVQFRRTTYDRGLKDHDLVEIYFIYQKVLEIWFVDLAVGVPSLVHESARLSEGAPVLSNQLLFAESHERDAYRSSTCAQYNLYEHGLRSVVAPEGVILSGYLYQGDAKTLLILVSSEECILIYRKYFSVEDGGFVFRRVNTPLSIVRNFKWGGDKSFLDLGQGLVKFGNVLLYKGELVESIPARSLFRMEGLLWGLLGEGKIRLIHLGGEVYQGFCIRTVECGIGEELMGIDSTSQFYCAYSRKGFEIFGKDFVSHWRCSLGNETIVCLHMFEHYVGMSYYDYYCDEEGVNDYNSVRFRFRVYNCATKNKIIEREKPLDEPILHIRYMAPDKLILVTSSLIFVNILKNDKTLELYRTHNFSSKRSFLSAFAYIPDILPAGFGAQGSPGYMLFGGSHGGLGFFVGKWIEEEKLKEQWFEGFRCGIRHLTFFHFSEQRDELLKALVADEDGNLVVLTLEVDRAQKVADIRLGSLVNTFKFKSGDKRAVFCTMGDGSIKLLTAVKLDGNEVSYLDFQKSFCEELPFYGGFNLRTSRRLMQKYRSGRLVSRGNIVDGDILQSFFSLTSTLRRFVLNSSDMELPQLKSILPSF